jgi:hypothetical protein
MYMQTTFAMLHPKYKIVFLSSKLTSLADKERKAKQEKKFVFDCAVCVICSLTSTITKPLASFPKTE